MPAGIEVCAVQLPGREDRYGESRFTRLDPLVETLGAALGPHLRPPHSFFGHSMGALIAFELARHLRSTDSRHRPRHLFASGRRAPHLPERGRHLHALPVEELKRELEALQGTPSGVLSHPELWEVVEPVLRADLAVCETYLFKSEPSPDGTPISALGGAEDPEATSDELDAWQLHTSNFQGRTEFPGHHFYLQKQWAPIARKVSDTLASVTSEVC